MSDVMDRVSEASHGGMLLVARVAMAALYLPSGVQKLTHLGAFAASLAQHGVPFATALAPIGAGVEFIGAVLILTGTRLRWAAIVMAVFTIVAALISHRFWELSGAAQANQEIHFLKNVAIVGGYLALFVAGPGLYSVDHWLAHRLSFARRWR
jgi:putative oxidoreductase